MTTGLFTAWGYLLHKANQRGEGGILEIFPLSARGCSPQQVALRRRSGPASPATPNSSSAVSPSLSRHFESRLLTNWQKPIGSRQTGEHTLGAPATARREHHERDRAAEADGVVVAAPLRTMREALPAPAIGRPVLLGHVSSARPSRADNRDKP